DNVSYIADNVYIKNNINAGDPFSPFWVLSIGPKVDQFIARNCTYFQSHGMFMQARNPINYVEIDHCTFVNNLKMQIFNENLTNAKITNNVFYNTLAIGESAAENADKDRDGLSWSIVNVDTLPGNEPGGSDPILAEADRSIEVRNNAWFRTPEVLQFQNDLGLFAGPFMNSRTQAMFDNDTDWPGLVEENNINEDPGFASFITDANALMMQYMNAFRGVEGDIFIWGFETDQDEFPTLFRVNAEWPPVENFQHNLSIMGTDGQPLGDLNWFGLATSVEDPGELAIETFILEQNYPNPFNPSTTIRYQLSASDAVSLSIYNINGQTVRNLVTNQRQPAGSYSISWDGTNDQGQSVSSGVYLYRLKTSTSVATRKMLFVK
ncbi:T9SS type A sorting domain-containing protein, partial [bacterium]|nr:T9SS type A sorting domain-containing protein [bacterium]